MTDEGWVKGLDGSKRGMPSAGRVTTLAADPDEVAELQRRLRAWDERIAALAAGGHLTWTTPPDGLADDMPLWRGFTGQSAAQIKGWGWLEALHPDDRAGARQEWERSVAERRTYEAEYRLRRADGVYRWFLTRALPVVGEDGALREWAGSSIDITERKQADEEMLNLLGVTDTTVQYLSEASPQQLNLMGLLGDLLDRVCAVLGVDNAAILLLEADERTLVLRAARGPEAALVERVRVPVGQGFAGRIAASGAPLVVDDLAAFDAVNPVLREQMRSAIGVPLLLHGRTVGVLHVAAALPRAFSDRDVLLLQRVGGRVALALDGTRLHEQGQAARAAAEAAHAELVQLQALTDTALSHLALEDLLRELLGRIAAVMGVEDIGILLLEPDGQTMTLRAALGLEEAAATHASIPVGKGVAGRAAATRTPLIVDDLASFDVHYPQLRATEQSAVAVPLLTEDRLLGVIYVGSAGGQRFTQRDVELLQRACDRIALAIDRARAFEDEQAARAEAERQAELLDRVLDTVADGVVVYDTEGRIVRANATMRRTLGLDAGPPEYFRMSPTERIALVETLGERGPRIALEDSIQMRALRGETMTGPDALEARLRTLDGREVEVIISAAPLRDREGRIVGAVASGMDVTERRRLARERAEQAQQLDRVIEGMTDGVFVYDVQGRVLRTNAAARRLLALDAAPPNFHLLSGHERVALYAPRDPDGRPITPDDWLVTRAMLGEASDGAETRDMLMRALDGRELEVGASAAPLHDADGHVVGAVLILSDRTERNRLTRASEEARAGEQAQRELNQRLDTFFAMAAHDLRAPVSVTKMRIQLAQRQLAKEAGQFHLDHGKQALVFAKVASALQTTEHDLDRLLRLIMQLLDVSRARAGTLAVARRPCDLGELVRERVEDQRLISPERTLTLDVVRGQPLAVEADADRLGQVVTNYLSNAVRYSREDQPIEVAVRVEGGEARVEVRDHGRGIAPIEHEYIWSRFQRAQSVREAEGLGLGLYIARMIVELHEGRVGVESKLGQGSTFWFTVPLASDGAAAEPARGG